jgi:hypothetical protein
MRGSYFDSATNMGGGSLRAAKSTFILLRRTRAVKDIAVENLGSLVVSSRDSS